MNVKEIKEIIRDLKLKTAVSVKIHEVDPIVIYEVANQYGLHVFTPEQHPMDFYFCQGWIDTNSRVITKKHQGKCKFVITSLNFEETKIYN